MQTHLPGSVLDSADAYTAPNRGNGLGATGLKGIVVRRQLSEFLGSHGSLAIPSEVTGRLLSAEPVLCKWGWPQVFFAGDWQRATGFDKLILFGPLFTQAPLAAFGTEHFTLTQALASSFRRGIPWHTFWA